MLYDVCGLLIVITFQFLVWSWGVLNDLFLMMSCCDMFDLVILESLISIILRYFLVACWEPMDIVIYHLMPFSCSWRTYVNIVDYLLILSNHLYRTEVFLYDSLICDFMSLAKLGYTPEILWDFFYTTYMVGCHDMSCDWNWKLYLWGLLCGAFMCT